MNLEEFNQNFVKLCEEQITLHDNIDDDNVFIYLLDNITCFIFDVKDVVENEILRHRFVYDTNIKKTIYNTNCLRFSKYYCDSIVFPFLNWNHPYRNLNAFQAHSYSFRTNDFLKANFITRLEKIDNNYYVVNYGNKKLLQKILTNKKGDCKTNTFMETLYHSIKSDITIKCEKELNSILHQSISLDNVKDKSEDLDLVLLQDHIKLYEYQKNDIKWMNDIKAKIDNDENILSVEESVFYNKVLDNEDYLIYNNTILPNTVQQKITNTVNVKYYGGNIVSEVGLGKSLIILSHILHKNNNKFNEFVEFDNETCNYFYKRGKNKTSNCGKKKCKDNDLYCKEHSTTLFIDKRNTSLKNLDKFNLRDYLVTKTDSFGNIKNYFKTNASLILCPNQLCDQWIREYYDKFKQTLEMGKRILLIVTYDQYKNLSFADILFADIIVVSYNFLLNTNYLKNTGYNGLTWNRKKRKSILDILDELDGDETITSINDLLNVHHEELNILDNYYYKGVYLDENHEILTRPRSDTLKLLVKYFKSDYKWNISATPFANGLSSFIYNTICTTNLSFELDNVFNLHENTVKSLNVLYRRNTRKTVQNEFSGNIIKEDVKLLKFTEQERSIYDAHMQGNIKHNRDFLIKLCCDTSIDVETRNLVKNCKTLDEIQKVILNHNKKKLIELANKIQQHKNRIEELLIIINRGNVINEVDSDGDIFENIEKVKIEIGIFRRKLTNDKKEYDIVNRTYTYLQNAIDNIKEIDTCPICLDDIQNDQIAITKCGHKFCKDCIYEFMEELNSRCDEVKCPKCNVMIQTSEIYLLKDVEQIIHTNDDYDELTSLIKKVKSTKIGNIIYYIKQQMRDDDKCIIFSQWDSMLNKIGNILKQEKIDTLYCSGTVYQRKQAITKFQNDTKSNIICLSSENCASGINLTSANKIILIEPIYGSKEYRKDIENQAIGRADRIGQKRPIEIIRFIIEDTIEHDIFNENKIDTDLDIKVDVECDDVECDDVECDDVECDDVECDDVECDDVECDDVECDDVLVV
jgi:SNF2 family DNA or RNA helicase